MSQENKTKPTDVPVEQYLTTVAPKRAAEATQLIRLMEEITGQRATMWGPSIIGFGSETYELASGRSGVVPQLAFSPRKTAITVYFQRDFEQEYADALRRLGPHKTGVACLYLRRLDQVDLTLLEEMLRDQWRQSISPKT